MARKKQRRVTKAHHSEPGKHGRCSGWQWGAEIPSLVLSPEQIRVMQRDVEEVLGLEPGSATGPGAEVITPVRAFEYSAGVMRRPAPGAPRFAAALVEAFQETLDPAAFEITLHRADDELVTLKGPTGVMAGPVGYFLRIPFDRDDRLELAVRAYMQGAADFVSRETRAQWPARAAELRVRVELEAVYTWWEAPEGDEPILVMRPLNRAELGL